MKPEELNFHVNYNYVDPFAFYDVIPEPKYLEMKPNDDLLRSFEQPAKKYD